MGTVRQLRQGTLAVHAGRIIVQSPAETDPPILEIPEKIAVRLNGRPVSGSVAVREGDDLRVDLPVWEMAGAVEVSVTTDNLECWVTVRPKVRRRLCLVDHEPASRLLLAVAEEEEREPVFTAAHVVAALKSQGIAFGVDAAAVQACVAASDGVARLVARGVPPEEGRDGRAECFFPMEPLAFEPGEEEPGG